jgi:LuxR family maltose regulon positive regulatory protein
MAGEPRRNPAALVALAWVHLEHNELREAHSWLKQAGAALDATPDKLIWAVAQLATAYGDMAEGRAAAAAQIIARARSGWPVPPWLDQRLTMVESRAHAAEGDIQAALAAARRSGHYNSPEAEVMLARTWAAAGNAENATRALASVLATEGETPDRIRLAAWLIDAQLSYHDGDHARGRRSLTSALRLAEPEQIRLPFALERGWIEPMLRSDPELAHAHHRLLAPGPCHNQLSTLRSDPDQAPILMVKTLTERELEVLRHASGLLSNAKLASKMYITVNTVKTHLKHIYRKLETTRRAEAIRRARQLELI